MVLSSMVPVVEQLLSETRDQLTATETDLVLTVLRRFDSESVARSLTPSCCEMKLLINVVKSQRCITAGDNSLGSAAIAQVAV